MVCCQSLVISLNVEFIFVCSFQEFYFENKQKGHGKESWIEEFKKIKIMLNNRKKKSYLIWRDL